ncbi:hypothetical protein HPS57_01090 [Prevotella sp. PINT]|jgi:hypothetical protein|uniref:hypothetical protein n=1 Tax=Palleniella intestinalis TaxID=2736291 RepID=UPI001555C07D|nr:hypothetical protein [Palleniella intestinalis]NPD80580.1 hypothetical protein [Palleniella intestinalis]
MENKEYLDKFEEGIHKAVYLLLLRGNLIDERMPDMPDIDSQWESIATEYLPDGIREFQNYPLVSLGWMMYVGMAVAHLWDKDWVKALGAGNLYTYMRSLRGYDLMDEAIREKVLNLKGEKYNAVEKIVGNCSQTALDILRKENIEPGTPMAFHAYLRTLKEMYRLGAATELFRLGYRMRLMS